ncbi:MAG: mandelate racemase/muconate lactonizing enzyme family protein [Alphaproteobacteria bacterium]|nr:mandelate racemase/muconate lactonizing enzyme family protein [Alphaproteobacteria bacterium]
MKIKDVKTWAVANPPPHHGGTYWVFLKLTTDNGIAGYGECFGAPFAPKRVCGLIEDVVERLVAGRSPFDIENIWRIVYSSGFSQHPEHTMGGVLSGIEIACWDIVGKALGQPIYNLLGGKVNERLRSYTYLYGPQKQPGDLGAIDIHSDPDAAPKRAEEYIKTGFTAVGFDPVMPMGSFDPRQISLEALVNAEKVTKNMREAAGDTCDLLLKTHGQMTTSSAIRLAKRLEKFDPLWFEEPTPPENKSEMARVARSTSIPVATGERLVSKYDFVDLLEKQAAAILQPALARVGGILEAKKIAGMAEAHYAQMAPHLYAGPIEAAANIQLGTCSPNFLIQESIETFDGFYADLLTKPIQWEEGYIIPPSEPGLGVELNEAVADANPVTKDDVFPPMAEAPVIRELA